MTETAVARTDEMLRQPGVSVNAFSSEGNFETAQRMASALSTSSLVPEAYKGDIPNCLLAIELASRTRSSVLMVMQNLDIVRGKPSWSSKFLIGTVNSSGRFSPLRYKFQGEEGTDAWGCRAVARDLEGGDECLGPLVTIAMAKNEEWYGKRGSKWQTIPELMLMYRSAAFWTRVYCPEIGLGLHTQDEMVDMAGAIAATPAGPSLEEAMSGLSDAPVIEAEIVEEDDGSEATDAQVEQLTELIDKAQDAKALGPDDVEAFELAIHDKNGPVVRAGIRQVQADLLAVTA